MSNTHIGPAGPRSSTEQEKRFGVKKSTPNTPIHRHAVGVSAIVETEDQILLHTIANTVGRETVRKSGLEVETFVESALLRVRANHAVTIAPVSLVGMEMHVQERLQHQQELHSPLAMFAPKKVSPKYKKVGETLAAQLGNSQSFYDPLTISDIDWYGENENVLVAKFDTTTSGYEFLQDLRKKVIKIFGGFGLEQLGIYPTDHVTLARFGTKRHPIEFNEDIKKYAEEITRSELVGTEISLAGVAVTRVAGDTIPLRKRSYDPSALDAYQDWKKQQSS